VRERKKKNTIWFLPCVLAVLGCSKSDRAEAPAPAPAAAKAAPRPALLAAVPVRIDGKEVGTVARSEFAAGKALSELSSLSGAPKVTWVSVNMGMGPRTARIPVKNTGTDCVRLALGEDGGLAVRCPRNGLDTLGMSSVEWIDVRTAQASAAATKRPRPEGFTVVVAVDGKDQQLSSAQWEKMVPPSWKGMMKAKAGMTAKEFADHYAGGRAVQLVRVTGAEDSLELSAAALSEPYHFKTSGQGKLNLKGADKKVKNVTRVEITTAPGKPG